MTKDETIAAAELTAERARAVIRYNPVTGELFWKARPRSDFKSDRSMKTFRARFEGKPCGTCKRQDYIRVKVDGRMYLAHRLAWLIHYGEWPDEVDHINGDRKDNRILNLRNAGRQENCKNQPLFAHNKSGVSGVRFLSREKRWIAQIGVKGKTHTLGYYRSFLDAVKARKTAEEEYGYHQNHGQRVAYGRQV